MNTPNDVLKGMVGDLMFEIATLRAQKEELGAKLVRIARMLPPEVLRDIAPELALEPPGAVPGNGGAQTTAPGA